MLAYRKRRRYYTGHLLLAWNFLRLCGGRLRGVGARWGAHIPPIIRFGRRPSVGRYFSKLSLQFLLQMVFPWEYYSEQLFRLLRPKQRVQRACSADVQSSSR